MPRNRVLSFMSAFGQPRSPTAASPDELQTTSAFETRKPPLPSSLDTASPVNSQQKTPQAPASPRSPDTPSRARGDSRALTRPGSMIQTYTPLQVEVAQDTPPELQPIFTFLNSHSNKLYQEGYFLKLHDLDARGRPSPARVWSECFAQLVGTVLSLWDAAALDQAGEDGEVVPTFINLSDASIKMIESLPMNGAQGGTLQNVLSVSTAANNRYLLHFNSLNSLTQWTAGIRLAMFEHATLQEAYTGSLIAGKGKYLNNIRQIMDRSRFSHEDWARVRFGAGTPWKRCWCVISPPDEKDYQKAQKNLKKTSTYSRALMPKGDIKFYDTRRITKKTVPIATVTDAYAAYAIYPQSKPLIDQSTLVKLEGLITIHGQRETTTEGFVFVMPEAHAAVTGFEMMLRWLFPVFDTFALYGRPTRLIADTLDQRGLMFALPRDRRYGFLDTLDVSGLIHADGSQNWSERQWRKEMKKLTSTRIIAQMEDPPRGSRQINQRRHTSNRLSLPPPRSGVQAQDAIVHSTPGSRSASPAPLAGTDRINPPKRVGTAPPEAFSGNHHQRSASDVHGHWKHRAENPSRLSHEASRPIDDDEDEPPQPPQHGGVYGAAVGHPLPTNSLQRVYSDDESRANSPYEAVVAQGASPYLPPPAPVLSPPAMIHNPNDRPGTQPNQAPELRRAHSNVDAATLQEMQKAVRPADEVQPVVPEHRSFNLSYRDPRGVPANQSFDFGNFADSESGSGMSRDPRQKLSTIPGSPYIGTEPEFFQSPAQAHMPQMDAVVGAVNGQQSHRPELTHLRSNSSITRKPVPRQQLGEDEQFASRQQPSQVRAIDSTSPDSPVSSGSLYDAVVDQDALERVLNASERTTTSASSSAPDYASIESARNQEKQEPREWQRSGKLKIVGDPDMPVVDTRSGGVGRLDTFDRDLANQAADLPTINFGPTYLYKPSSRPGTSGTMTPADLETRRTRSRSADRLRQSSGSRLSGYFPTQSPAESHRNSYFGVGAPTAALDNTEPVNQRQSVAWTPGTVMGGTVPGGTPQRQTLTAEEWVQYRAALASQPQQAPRRSPVSPNTHQRPVSTGNLHQQLRQSASRTPPPFARTASGDWSGLSRTPPSRPNSRGAGVFLNPSPGVGVGNNQTPAVLTAKEQMYIARASGTPLINVANKGKPGDEQAPGLVGALVAREREKAALSQGVRSEMVQHAILARQQQQLQVEAEARAQARYEMQQRAQQEEQAQQYQQQMAHRRSMISQHQLALEHQQAAYEHEQRQSMQLAAQQNYGGYGGQYVQQQGMMPQQRVYSGVYHGTQQGPQGQQYQQARR